MVRVIISVLFFLLFPTIVLAACADKGYTVVYVNGILTSEDDAKKDLALLEKKFQEKSNLSNFLFISGHNSSHLAGLGDWIKSVEQIYSGSASTTSYIDDYDLKTILLQIYPEVTTRKILLVGHSQGTFYANAIYNYLLSHGVPRESVGVYNIATPAHFVAGEGRYLTSATDQLIIRVRNMARTFYAPAPLLPNILLPITAQELTLPYGGHSLSSDYLTNAPDRIVSDIEQALERLEAKESVLGILTGDCFTPPPRDVAYELQSFGFLVAEPIAQLTYTQASQAYVAVAYAGREMSTLALLLSRRVATLISDAASMLAELSEPFSKTVVADQEASPVLASIMSEVSPAHKPPALPPEQISPEIIVPEQNEMALEETIPEPPLPPQQLQPPQPEFVPLIPPPPPVFVPYPGFGGGESSIEQPPVQAVPQEPETSISEEPEEVASSTPDEVPDLASTTPEVSVAEAAWFCAPDTEPMVDDVLTVYQPESGDCTYVSGFITEGILRGTALYLGTLGDAVLVSTSSTTAQLFETQGGIPPDALPGDPFFIAIWELRETSDEADFHAYLSAALLDSALIPPHEQFRVLPFTFGAALPWEPPLAN